MNKSDFQILGGYKIKKARFNLINRALNYPITLPSLSWK